MKYQARFTWLVLLLIAGIVAAQKADPADPANSEKGKQLLQKVITARGGAAFLNYQTMQASGQWTPFEQGLSTVPIPFVDYVILPDKERTEFGKAKKKKDRKIQVNVGKTGWVYDGDAETLKDQDDKRVLDHLENLDADIDRVLRAAVTRKDAEIKFYGREETRPGERADVVAIKLKPEFMLYLQIDPYTSLPMSLSYQKGAEKFEFRFAQYVAYDGVKFPNIVDFYKDKIQLSRVNYESIKLNAAIPDSLFVKPASAKEVK